MNTTLQDTIVALATPPLKSALAIVRLSGTNAISLVQSVFSKSLHTDQPQSMHTGWILNGEERIDQVVVLVYHSPHSFTGEDSVEIMTHGSPLITQQVIQLCVAKGARLAQKGEFSSRAYLNQKIDLIQAEAIYDVIEAQTPEAKKLSLFALGGQLSQDLSPIRVELANLLSLIEVNIDYPEYEDIEHITLTKVIDACSSLDETINRLMERGEKGRLINEGVKVAIVGRPNVGKSSLLNALVHEEKAIVTDIEGTTRDVVEAQFNLHGIPMKILDTAGIRQSEDRVESIGIERSVKAVSQADLVLYVLDASNPNEMDHPTLLNMLKEKQTIKVYNKQDLTSTQYTDGVLVSAKDNTIQPLLDAMQKVLGVEPVHYQQPNLTNARQLGVLQTVQRHILQAKEDAMSQQTMDILSSSLQLAYEAMLGLLGLEGKVDLSEEIFSRFCVGK
jgi:tRNA modification GTPase